MKKLSLKDFILEIKKELTEVQTKNLDKAFFELKEVNIEVSFTLDTSVKGSGKFVVVNVDGTTKASQVHKVSIKLDPIKHSIKKEIETSSPVTELIEPKKTIVYEGKTYEVVKSIDESFAPMVKDNKPFEDL